MDLRSLNLDNLLGLNDQNSDELVIREVINSTVQTDCAIAIIGMSGKIGGAENFQEFWQMLVRGDSARRSLPLARRNDLESYLRLRGADYKIAEENYLHESFLEEIATFDYRFFGLSRQEANLMDPNQRLFLQCAWSALEDAGYSGDVIKGSKTGVFCGFSADFGPDYRHIVNTFAPDAPEISVAGNIRSIIASRIAYHLDLRGPSMVIDTACSSGLVGVYQACKSIRSGESDMALAGAVKLDLLPLLDQDSSGIGTKDIDDTIARDGRTKTFDDRADGTSGAEGVLCFVLKAYDKAVKDGDMIHAVILGGAINQDGLSVGITAPNSAAQEALIVSALEDANVNPEQVSYIEAHGTATKLGDPIEISGIQRAFSRFTARKQFCALGSVKTNIGHMDNAAGLAGLAKVILAMKHRQLPPSLNFQTPNRNIPFEQSPVFVNDRLTPWNPAANAPLIAGINSFGLSGTNCHVLLQNYNAVRAPAKIENQLIVLSALSGEALRRQARNLLSRINDQDIFLADIAFTLLAGRFHHAHRLALVVDSLNQLREGLDSFLQNPATHDRCYVNQLKFANNTNSASELLTEAKQHELSRQAEQQLRELTPTQSQWQQLAELYVQGANPAWSEELRAFALRTGRQWHRCSLPAYPFEADRCWVEQSTTAVPSLLKTYADFGHPLIDTCLLDSHSFYCYQTRFSATTHWVLSEHRIHGSYVLPGTCYLEMFVEIASRLVSRTGAKSGLPLFINRLQFLKPFAIGADEQRDLHVQVNVDDGNLQLRAVSRIPESTSAIHNQFDWQVHAEASIELLPSLVNVNVDLNSIRASLLQPLLFSLADDVRRGLDISARWNDAFVAGWRNESSTEFLVELALPQIFASECDDFNYHPALLDVAVNAVNHLVSDDDLFLPFSYKDFSLTQKLPAECFVYLTTISKPGAEIFNFTIQLISKTGEMIGKITNYAIKRVAKSERFSPQQAQSMVFAPSVKICPPAVYPAAADVAGPMLFIHRGREWECALIEGTRQQLGQRNVCAITIAENNSTDALQTNLLALDIKRPGSVIYLAGADEANTDSPLEHFTHLQSCVNAMLNARIQPSGAMLVIANQGTPLTNESNAFVIPGQAALAAFARIAALENPQLHLRCIDITIDQLQHSDSKWLLNVIHDPRPLIGWRNGNAYVAEVDAITLPSVEKFSLKTDGVYLITGGVGALGFALALEMAGDFKQSGNSGVLTIALCGSCELAAQDDSQVNYSAERVEKIHQQLRELRELGVLASYHCVELSDSRAVSKLLNELRQNYGRILGVVHAAGRAGAGFIANKSIQQLENVFVPKAMGAWWLHTHTRQDELDFFVMYSSIATVLHNPGQSDYTAANAFLNALAELRRQQGLPALSVCWPAWREIGIAVAYGAVDEAEFFAPINPGAALTLLKRALNHQQDLPAVVVLAELNRAARAEDLIEHGFTPSPTLEQLLRSNKRNPVAHATSGDSNLILTGIEKPDAIDNEVAGLWGKVLATKELNVDDHFSDLGGNSILTTQLYKEYERRYSGVFDMADLFSKITIRSQADHIRNSLGRNAPAATEALLDIDDILAKLANGELSAEEAQSLL